ncbi:hypothetical protein [Rhizobium sp. FY34]|uniref:hypothetical protein n=1 Tax=Rhizobium sp. FY34 TaxID=2562309 RepID=UPI0014854CF0|nr:hypothetical protein [Rhizobium sp. FY34]
MTLPRWHSGAAISLLAAFFAAILLVLAFYGWIVHGPALLLAMQDSLAAWCM